MPPKSPIKKAKSKPTSGSKPDPKPTTTTTTDLKPDPKPTTTDLKPNPKPTTDLKPDLKPTSNTDPKAVPNPITDPKPTTDLKPTSSTDPNPITDPKPIINTPSTKTDIPTTLGSIPPVTSVTSSPSNNNPKDYYLGNGRSPLPINNSSTLDSSFGGLVPLPDILKNNKKTNIEKATSYSVLSIGIIILSIISIIIMFLFTVIQIVEYFRGTTTRAQIRNSPSSVISASSTGQAGLGSTPIYYTTDKQVSSGNVKKSWQFS